MKSFVRVVAGILTGVTVLSCGAVFSNAATVRYNLNDTSLFRDTALANFIKANYDTNKDNYLSLDEIAAVTSIDISSETNIVDLRPLIYFTSVNRFNISNNKVSNGFLQNLLSGSFGKQLTEFTCRNCNLMTLDVSNCSSLRTLKCNENSIRYLNLINNPNLLDICEPDDTLHYSRGACYYEDTRKQLWYDDGVDIYIAPYTDYFTDVAFYLNASDNLGFDIADPSYITPDFIRTARTATELDLSFSTRLARVSSINGIGLFKNLETLNMPNNDVVSADLSSLTHLKTLDISDNKKLTNLTLGSIPLETLKASGCGFSSVNLSGLSSLKDLTLGVNAKFTSVDISHNTNLTNFKCTYSGLTQIDVSNCPNLSYLNLTNNKISNLDLSNNPNLSYLIVINNPVTEIDISNNPNLLWGVTPNRRTLYGVNSEYARYSVSTSTTTCYVEVDAGVTFVTPAPKAGWENENGSWYYYISNQKVTDWQLIDEKWYYFDSNGVMLTGWQLIGDKWYYFKSSGAMTTGWKQIGDNWYYFKSSGAMTTGWKQIGDNWYYFKSSGAMVTGWKQIGDKWYYFKSSGAMVTGWKQIGDKWYYFDSNGAMLTGWQKINNKHYYFYSSGAMACNTWVNDKYYVDANGVWTQTR